MPSRRSSYHGLSYVKAFGKLAYITKCTAHLMRDFGSIPSPFNAFLVNLGLESLHLRIRRHADSALKIAKWLRTQKKVAWVNFAGLSDSKYNKLVKKQFDGPSPCGVMTFGIKGGRDASIRFMDSLKLIGIVTHVADAWSCVLHPASHTHRQLTDEQLRAAGIPPDLIRLSVGLEDPSDLIADLRMALRLGAEKVYLVYRRSLDEMPARREEIHHAKEEGVEFHMLENAKRILGDDKGFVCGMECLKYELGEPDASGRRSPVAIAGSEFTLDVDTVVVAVGNASNPLIPATTEGLEINKRGNIVVDPETNMTSIPGVFAGGDIVLGAATVILAMGEGRRAAAGIPFRRSSTLRGRRSARDSTART